jgi:hypothetical protein
MKERRTQERRSFKAAPNPLVKDNKGQAKLSDRRRIPDRRLNNITVEYISLNDFYNSKIHVAEHS